MGLGRVFDGCVGHRSAAAEVPSDDGTFARLMRELRSLAGFRDGMAGAGIQSDVPVEL